MSPGQEEALYHLGYEWWMFRTLHALLQGLPDTADPVRNAIVESLAMHGRDLIDFFYADSPLRPDDNSLVSFGLPRVAVTDQVVTDWRTHTNKRIAHVTNQRTRAPYKWPTEQLLQLLTKQISAFRSVIAFPVGWTGDTPESASPHLQVRPHPTRQSLTVGTGYDTGTGMMDLQSVIRFDVSLDKPGRY